jgi:cytochrome c oxidase assembly factor CtaG
MLAHQVVGPAELAGAWSLQPVLLATLVLSAALYRRGGARLASRVEVPERHRRWRRDAAFYGALVLAAAALVSPLDALSSSLFSAHMVQHLLLMLAVAPLLVYARPLPRLTLGLPAPGRAAVRQAGAWRGARAVAGAAAHPVVVWCVGTIVLWGWHMPLLYSLALAHGAVHALEHATLLGAAVLFWRAVIGTGAARGASRPVAMLVVLATGLAGTALGVVLVFASAPLYPDHAAGAAAWGLSALQDQQVAGALMWGPPALVYVAVIVWLLVRWFGEIDDATEPVLVPAGHQP